MLDYSAGRLVAKAEVLRREARVRQTSLHKGLLSERDRARIIEQRDALRDEASRLEQMARQKERKADGR